MKSGIYYLFALISVNTFGQSSDIDSIHENFRQQERCWNQQDMHCYCEAYADVDSVRTISRVGVTYGKNQILQDYLKWPKERMGKLHFDQMNITALGQAYYFVTGRFNLTYANDEVRSGFFSAIMIKEKGAWKILTDHSS